MENDPGSPWPPCTICDGAGSFDEQEYVLPFGKPGYSRLTGKRRKCLTCLGSGISPRLRGASAVLP